MNYLAHHGVKGQKWGIKNGPPYPITKYSFNVKKNINYMNQIFDSMSTKDKKLLYPNWKNGKSFATENDSIALSIVKKYKDVPVSFIAAFNETQTDADIGIGTRSGKEFRGKGHGNDVVKKLLDNIGNTKVKNLYWYARKDNIGSNKLAQKYGFKQIKIPYDKWNKYVKKVGD